MYTSIGGIIILALISIGKTAYLAMVEMALEFQKGCLYTEVMENDQ